MKYVSPDDMIKAWIFDNLRAPETGKLQRLDFSVRNSDDEQTAAKSGHLEDEHSKI
jgi:hypothetical protein